MNERTEPLPDARKAEILSLAESTPHRTLIPVGEAAALVREIEGLEEMKAIIDRLPRTADGVTITPGMSVYRPFGMSESIMELMARDVSNDAINDGIAWALASRFYSTKEAAESALAARGREAGEGNK